MVYRLLVCIELRNGTTTTSGVQCTVRNSARHEGSSPFHIIRSSALDVTIRKEGIVFKNVSNKQLPELHTLLKMFLIGIDV